MLVQNSGNPVLDSTVNVILVLYSIPNRSFDPAVAKLVHETFLELAAKEPGGLRRPAESVRSEKASQ